MAFSLILNETPDDETSRDVGENIFLRDLQEEYKVFAFYYPSAMRDADLENALRGLGELTGKNMLVNIGRLDDPDFDRITGAFDIKSFPVVVMTGIAELAAPPGQEITTYVRLDNSRLLSDADRTVVVAQEIYGLFLRGAVAEAASKANWTQRTEGLRAVASSIVKGLQQIVDWIAERDISISIMEGTFELKKSSG